VNSLVVLPAILLPPAAGFLAYAAVSGHERRAERRASVRPAARPLTEEQQLVADLVHRGPNALRGWMRTLDARLLHLRQRRDQAEADEARHDARYERWFKPVLERHPHLVPFVVLMLALAIVGGLMFVAQLELETGLIKTLMPNDAPKARLLGAILAVAGLVLGGTLMELVFPGEALPSIKSMSRRLRVGLVVGVATLFVVFLLVLPQLAMVRADTLYGQEIIDQRATCTALTTDDTAPPERREIACNMLAELEHRRDRARGWDVTVAIVAPLVEAIGVWALLPVLQLAAVAVAARLRRRAGRATRAAADRLAQGEADRNALVERALVTAGIGEDEFAAWQRGLAGRGLPAGPPHDTTLSEPAAERPAGPGDPIGPDGGTSPGHAAAAEPPAPPSPPTPPSTPPPNRDDGRFDGVI
jgi:hypothetical protein